MNGFKILSVVLAVLLVGYVAGSATVIRQMRGRIVETESRCKELKSRCAQLESQRTELREPVTATTPVVDAQSDSTGELLQRLRETLEFREMELAELSSAYDSLQAEHDALQGKMENMPELDLPPGGMGMMPGMMGGPEMSAEERELRRQEFVDRALDRLQERMDQMSDDEKIQQNLELISDNIEAIAELREQWLEATDEETRREVGGMVREQGRDLMSLMREERNLELAYVARKFGVKDTEGFVQAIDGLSGGFAPGRGFMGPPLGSGFGGRRFR